MPSSRYTSVKFARALAERSFRASAPPPAGPPRVRAVLAGERGPEPPLPRRRRLDLLEEPPEEVGVAEVELEAVEPQHLEALDGHRDDLDFGLGLLEPDQLDAGLVELAVVRDPGLVVAEDVGHVREADRLALVAGPRRGHARDLRRDARAQREEPPRLPVDQLEHVLLHAGVGAGRERVRVLERGRDDLAVAPASEDAEEARLDVALAGRLVGQVDPRALRELRRQRHGPAASRWASVFIRCTVAQPGSNSISVMLAGEASTDQSRSSPRPSASSTSARAMTAWLTSTSVASGCAPASAASPRRTRAATSGSVSASGSASVSGAV